MRSCKQKVQNLFLAFLEKTALIHEVNTKLGSLNEKLHRLQKNMKSYNLSMQTRQNSMCLIWKTIIEKLSSYFMSHAKRYPQAFMKDIGLKLPFINEEIK